MRNDIKFSKDQLTKEGDLPRLFNYSGWRFDIKDVIGEFDKDSEGKIILTPNHNDKGLPVVYTDKKGWEVNKKGYLIDSNKNIVNQRGLIIWKSHQLNSEGEFAKIFPFTKFNIDLITGCLDWDVNGKLIILEGSHGETVD